MALNSINTNAGALVALQNLNQTNRDLAVAQGRINTGMKWLAWIYLFGFLISSTPKLRTSQPS